MANEEDAFKQTVAMALEQARADFTVSLSQDPYGTSNGQPINDYVNSLIQGTDLENKIAAAQGPETLGLILRDLSKRFTASDGQSSDQMIDAHRYLEFFMRAFNEQKPGGVLPLTVDLLTHAGRTVLELMNNPEQLEGTCLRNLLELLSEGANSTIGAAL